MKNIFFTLLLILVFGCSSSQKSRSEANSKKEESEFQKASNFVCSLLRETPMFSYKDHFHEAFRKAISYEQVVAIFSSIYQEHGACQEINALSSDGVRGEAITRQGNGKELKFILSLAEEDGKNKIGGLLYKGPVLEPVVIESFKQLQSIAREQAGNFSLYFKEIDGEEIFDYKADSRRALGSIFKLYILAAALKDIQKGELSWQQKFKIQEKFKSLPSGNMQNLPDGTEVSVFKFAKEMISVSDNTATDHLLSIVRKREVERLMKTEELNSFLADNAPFISTLEMFQTRAFLDSTEVATYVKSPRQKRVEKISGFPKLSRAELMQKLSDWLKPRYINEIEWFASPRDICETYAWMDEKNDPNFRKVMGFNTPFIDLDKSKRWKYAGYKGGSEPGVLEMAYLLEDNGGKKYCLYMGQNDSKNNINQERFFALVEGIINFLEK